MIGRRYMWNGAFNIHRAHNHPEDKGSWQGTPTTVDNWSEGCQVFPRLAEFDQFLIQCQLTKWRYCQKGKLDSCTWAQGQTPHGTRDHLSSCDLRNGCSVKFDYVLVELPGADLDKVVTEYNGLDKRPEGSPTFKNDNKLFVGGPVPAEAAPAKPQKPAAPPAKPAAVPAKAAAPPAKPAP